jgi:3-methyladenine DNA glycosylase AlkD
MLKEVSRRDSVRVFDYVVAHRDMVSRVALRYAIEKLDPELRKKAMERE